MELKWRLLKKPYILGHRFVTEIAIQDNWVAVGWSLTIPSMEKVHLTLLPAVEALRLSTGCDCTAVPYCYYDGEWVPCRSEEEE